MKRIYYEELTSCLACPHNHDGLCYYRAGTAKPISEDLFMNDCHMPTLVETEGFTRYIGPGLTLKVCGNCRYWEREGFNREDRGADFGWCPKIREFPNCNESNVCDRFVMVGDIEKGQVRLL